MLQYIGVTYDQCPRSFFLCIRDALTFHIVWITAMEKRRDILARIPRALAAESGKPVTGLLAVGKGTSYRYAFSAN